MLSRTSELIRNGRPVRIVLYGDSITEVDRTPGYFGGASCREKNWGWQLRDQLAKAFPSGRWEVASFGIGGQNAFEGLGRLDWLRPLAPDLVLVSFGANDCGYHFLPPDATAQALAALVDGIRALYQADVVIMGMGADNPQSPCFVHREETLAAIEKVAAEKRAPYVNTRRAILQATRDGRAWADYHTNAQDCHPNDAGHAVWAAAAAEVIQGELKGNPA